MDSHNPIPTVPALKARAKRLRADLAADGHTISHGRALELLAGQLGYKDWNTLHAAAGNRPDERPLAIGERVRGRYLGQPFEGEVLAIARRQGGARLRVTIHFDQPVDVVTFDSFSSYRQRVSCTLNRDWTTTEKTSNGQPQMRLDR